MWGWLLWESLALDITVFVRVAEVLVKGFLGAVGKPLILVSPVGSTLGCWVNRGLELIVHFSSSDHDVAKIDIQ